MKKKRTKGLEAIEWIDSHSPSGGWHPWDEIDLRVLTLYSVGWVMHETKKVVTVVAHRSFDSPPSNVEGVITIPKAAIVSRVKLEPKS